VRSLVLDTSVAIAWYLPETFRAAARAWQSLLDGRVRLVVPGLHYWEPGNALRNYVMRSELEGDLAEQIWALHLEAPLEVAEPERAEVLATALEYGATVYDAVYIALSRSLDLPLLTAERTTTPWVVKLGGRVESVARTPRRAE
jgi:predicted nucleic acid-binding protein